MTESTIKISEAVRKFILHWGEMGTKWGINRTVSQIHALLYISEEPLNAEQISQALMISRSNVSMSLKELGNWGLVRVTRKQGDRRDYFESMVDVWEMFRVVMAERKRREIDPTLTILRECVEEMEQSNKREDEHSQKQLKQMLGFFETISTAYEKTRNWPTKSLVQAIKLSEKVRGVLGLRTK